MKKRTKKYRPKQVVMNPINYFMGGLKRIDSEHLCDLTAKNYMALHNISIEQATKDQFDNLVGMCNMAIVLSNIHFDDAYIAELHHCRDSLLKLGQRYLSIGKFVLTGEERQHIETALEIHDAQLEACRVIDVERACDEVLRRIKNNINTTKIKSVENV